MDLKKSENLPTATSKFSQLLPGKNETTIVVRVTRVWKSVSGYDSTEIIANFILLDEEVTIIYMHKAYILYVN